MKIHRASEQKGQSVVPSGPMDTSMLFRAHADFVAAFLRRLGVPEADLDDAVQEVFLVTHRKGGYVPGPALPRTWLVGIALHVARANGRKRARRRETSEVEAPADTRVLNSDPHARLAARETLGRVQTALDTLDFEHRAAFVLYEIEGETCDAIAEVFGIPLGTVHSRLHHARRRFMRAYAASADDDAEPRVKIVEGA